jgi:2-methylcitrate dehydratase PrpD
VIGSAILTSHFNNMADSIELNAPDLLLGATQDLSKFASSLSYEDIPPPVVSYVKDLILDNFGVVLYGNQTPWAKLVIEMAEEAGASPRSTILGCGIKTSPALAALANGTGGHSFEFDEIHRDSGFHPGSIIIPVVTALAESEGGCSGRDFITAAVAAYEVGCRVGMSCGSDLFFRGHHPQGCTGVFSAATAAARILRLDPEATQNALGIAGTHAAGLMAAQEGAMVKRMHAGSAAQNGVYGALLGRKGFTGIHNVLEVAFGGYLSTLSGNPTTENLTSGLGERWETLNVAYKPYATVASIHTALDGLHTIMVGHHLKPDDIESIDVGCGKVTYMHCAWEYKPTGVTSAQMNLFYSMAVVAIDGEASTAQFSENRLKDPQILALIGRMKAHISPEIEAKGRTFRHSVVVSVTTKDGRSFKQEELYRRGTRENPPRPGDVEKKFRDLAGYALNVNDVQRLLLFIRDLENKDSLEELFSILAGTNKILGET